MIHCYQLNGYNIVLDVCSGAVHVVDEVAYDIIAMFEDNSREAILSAIGENIPPLQQASWLSAMTRWRS